MSEHTCVADDCERGGRLRRGLCDMHYQRWQHARGIQHISDRTCSIEGCGSPHKSKGLCGMHYARLIRTGSPGPAGRKNFPAPPECTADGCTAPPRTKGLCGTHYSRFLTHGDPNVGAFTPRGTCTIPGCGKPHYARGYCETHYGRWWRHGDPLRVDKPAGPNIGYGGVHTSLRNTRGRAAEHSCQHCGAQAREWAYDHGDPAERRDPRGGWVYSLDPAHYMPLCARCHKIFDRSLPA